MPEPVSRPCWCGAAAARGVFEVTARDGRRYPLVCCEGCGIHALHPPPDDETLRVSYDAEYYGGSPRKFIGPLASLVSWFQQGRARLVGRRVAPGGRILDVGCGNGRFLERLAARGYVAEGTEWTAASAARAAGLPGVTLHTGDLLSLDLPGGAYDAVTLWHVLEHVRRPRETLERIHRLLAREGMLFLALPNQASWQARAFGPAWFHLDPPRHLHGFCPRSLRALLEVTRYSVRRMGTFSFEQNPFGFVQSLLNALGFPRDRAYQALKASGSRLTPAGLLDLALVGGLAVPGVVLSTLSSALGAGATLTVEARKS
jgi:SAM-dependent methyltransferase